MLKKLACLTVTTILLSSINTFVYANNDNSNLPSVVSSSQFPRKRQSVVKHIIRVKVPQDSHNIAQLKIVVPPKLTVRNEIKVHDESGKEISVNPVIEGNTIIIDISSVRGFLEIDLDKVIPSGSSNIWIYRVFAKYTDGQELYIGRAEIRSIR